MNEQSKDSLGELLIYQTEKGTTRIDTYLVDETIWMNQKALSSLYQVTSQNITMHIQNIVNEGELDLEATCKELLQVQNEGGRNVSRMIKFYNLDMVLAIGYRVKSDVGTQFRKWASNALIEYMQKGFVLNDERLKNPKVYGADYFDELLERIRDIRASEKRLYRKITDVFATSIDYDSKSETAKLFFQTVQNKLHFAVTGQTAAEIVHSRADASKNNMGLTNFSGAVVRKTDISVAKNYLTKSEISHLNQITTMYLDYAELQAKKHQKMHMSDWTSKLDQFLKFNEEEVLTHAGRISHDMAEAKALDEYELYDTNRKALDLLEEEIKDNKS